MAKKHHTRANSRKPKLIDVEGHLLSPALHHRYESAVICRMSQGRSNTDARRVGLEDVLNEFQPSTWTKEELNRAFWLITHTNQSVGHMATFNWFAEGAPRLAGCELLRKLEQELALAVSRVTAVRCALEGQAQEKLQDWQARRASLSVLPPVANKGAQS
jgi:hypothetical protein